MKTDQIIPELLSFGLDPPWLFPCRNSTSIPNVNALNLCDCHSPHLRRASSTTSSVTAHGDHATVSTNGVVNTNELQLAAKLAKIDLPEDFLLKTPYTNKYAFLEAQLSTGGKWRNFYKHCIQGDINKEEFLKQHALKRAASREGRRRSCWKAAAAAAQHGAIQESDIPEVSIERRAHLQ